MSMFAPAACSVRAISAALSGGHRKGDKGYFVEPTILVNTREDMKVVREEIFGPVVAAMPFDDPEEILPRANNSEYGLAAAVWTRDISKAHRTAELLRAGTVWINCYNIFDAALPFGGYKQSGWGREMGHDALNLYTQTKAICTKIVVADRLPNKKDGGFTAVLYFCPVRTRPLSALSFHQKNFLRIINFGQLHLDHFVHGGLNIAADEAGLDR